MQNDDHYKIDEQCDYCGHRWIAVMPQAVRDAMERTGPVCPRCHLQNDPRIYNDIDLRPPPTKSA